VLVDTLPVDLLHDEPPDGVARRLTAEIAMRSRVLEIGCGTGALARVLARRGANVTAIDRAPMIDLARSRTPSHLGIDYRVGELQRLSPRGFDVAIAVSALHELPLAEALARIAEAVRPGGSIVIVDRLGPWWATLSEIRRVIERVLPGAIVRRHLGWRYSARWTRPV
jgi:2-polyprenyl-3-methyl-5-hydroxy-6-metoxy-1,4-benzoquinol methylase